MQDMSGSRADSEFSALAAQGITEPAHPRGTLARFFLGRTLENCLASGRDNILMLRLVAASMVMLGHSGLGGGGHWPHDPIRYLMPRMQVERTGLFVFFLLSGFLITLSYQRRPNLLRFLWSRALRIWPGLIFCALLLAFVLGPLVTVLPLSDYFNSARGDNPYRFISSTVSLLGSTQHLPGVFTTGRSAARGVVDAPLWSLTTEVTMYLIVAGVGAIGLWRFPRVVAIGIIAFLTWRIVLPMFKGIEPGYVIVVEAFFGVGAILCLLRRYVPVSSGILLCVLALCAFAQGTPHALPINWLAVTYTTLWFAYVPRIPAPPRDMDLSYGTYIWGWPILQVLVLWTPIHEPIILCIFALALALPIAAVSWFFVEKPALRFKNARWIGVVEAWRERVVGMFRREAVLESVAR
jgi:peptidoglycan/LPS O-acetylase OafA/YrhL